MLLENYTTEIFRPECNANFQSLHCFAHLNEDISEVIPYLNTVFGGTNFTKEPASVMFRVHGRLIAIHPKKIAINALKDEAEASKILHWLINEINETWEKRADITPSYEVATKPQPVEVLKLLPKTNCKACGQPTCIVFASLILQGAKNEDDCPELNPAQKQNLHDYLSQFNLADI